MYQSIYYNLVTILRCESLFSVGQRVIHKASGASGKIKSRVGSTSDGKMVWSVELDDNAKTEKHFEESLQHLDLQVCKNCLC